MTKNIHFSPYETSFLTLMTTVKATLWGFLSKVSGIEPTSPLFPMEIIQDAKPYIQQVAIQVNGCYERGWFDPCTVMLRRLIETLIIECFERYQIESKIKGGDGNYFYLKDLITHCLNESSWNLSRNTKSSLPKLKDIGDLSAHNRYFIAKRKDIESIQQDVRVVIQELNYISSVKQ